MTERNAQACYIRKLSHGHRSGSACDRTDPAVELRSAEGLLCIHGCSIPENADRFYSSIQDRIEAYALHPKVQNDTPGGTLPISTPVRPSTCSTL
ncbi:MAG: DUF1987 family protein [Flavobacteriales bacterium]|nr:DUF1987 family protein [Flavobacteriales bacterium]